MKLLLIAACIFVVANGQLDKLRANFDYLLKDCKEIVGASDVDINQYKHQISPESDAGKCLITCVNKKIKIQDPNGKINPEATRAASEVLKGIDENVHKKMLIINEKCIKEVVDGSDECEIGSQWFACVSKAQNEAGIPLLLVDA